MSQPAPDQPITVQSLIDQLIDRLQSDLGYSEDEAKRIAETARPAYRALIPRPASEGTYGRHPAPPDQKPAE